MPEASQSVALLLVQPWFTAPGHPAQSLLHAARALGPHHKLGFLVPRAGQRHLPDVVRELAGLGTLLHYTAPGNGFPASTAAAVSHLPAFERRGWHFEHVLFFDAHLPVLLGFTAAGLLRDRSCGAIVLQGPERALRSGVRRQLLRTALARSALQLYCRTDELAGAWRDALPHFAHRFHTLPSLELAPAAFPEPASRAGPLRLGVLGQIRAGKGIERIVAACDGVADVTLTIAGPYASAAARRRFEPLLARIAADCRFLPEHQLHTVAAEQDYILLLYDDWDARMESGVFSLAAMVGRPVIAYRGGWCERQIAAYGCGIAFDPGTPLVQLATVPRPGEQTYMRLLEGMRRFAADHSADTLAPRFLAILHAASTQRATT